MDAQLAEAIKATLPTYSRIREEYYKAIFIAIYDYLDSDGSVSKFKNAMKRALTDAFFPAGEVGWEDAGNDLPIDGELSDWIVSMQDAEFGYIDALFQTLRQMRKDGEVNKTDTATARAEGYTQTLDRIYNYAKVFGGKNRMLTFAGDDGAESCTDCKRYKGKRHKAKWWIENNAVPPNRDFECKGYNCNHVLVDDKGTVWTL